MAEKMERSAQRRLRRLKVQDVDRVPEGFRVARFGLCVDAPIAMAAAFDQFAESWPKARFRVARNSGAVGVLSTMSRGARGDQSKQVYQAAINEVRRGSVVLLALVEK